MNERPFTFIVVIASPVPLWICLHLYNLPQRHPRPPSRTLTARLPVVTAAQTSLQEQLVLRKVNRLARHLHDRSRTLSSRQPPTR